MKRCSACKEQKDESEYNFKNKKAGTLQSKCRECQAEYCKEWYQENRERELERAKERRRKNSILKRDYVYGVLSASSCVDCGFDDIRALQFDHIDPESKTANVSDMLSGSGNWYTLGAVKREIAKCVVRCANCHSIKTSEQGGFWKEDYLDVA